MRKYFLFFIIIASNGCEISQKPELSKKQIFNWYNKSDSLVRQNAFELLTYHFDNIDSIVVMSNDTIYCKFLQVFDSSGIYRYCDGKKVKTHSLQDTLIRESCGDCPPFLNKDISYRGKKNFIIGDKTYTVYHFIESIGDHTSYDSYYIASIGPVCYYSFDKDAYIFCDGLIGYNFKDSEMKKFRSELSSDTLFFARHILKKLMPNYHRVF